MSSAEPQNADAKWLLIKRGLYWRPDALGYTGLKSEAGRYTDDDVQCYRDAPSADVTIIDADTAPEFSPRCPLDVIEHHRKLQMEELISKVASLEAQLAEALLCQQEIAAGTTQSATVARIIIAKNNAELAISTLQSAIDQVGEALDRWTNSYDEEAFKTLFEELQKIQLLRISTQRRHGSAQWSKPTLDAISTLAASVEGAYSFTLVAHEDRSPKGHKQTYEGPSVPGVFSEWVDHGGGGITGDDFHGTVTFVLGDYHLVVSY